MHRPSPLSFAALPILVLIGMAVAFGVRGPRLAVLTCCLTLALAIHELPLEGRGSLGPSAGRGVLSDYPLLKGSLWLMVFLGIANVDTLIERPLLAIVGPVWIVLAGIVLENFRFLVTKRAADPPALASIAGPSHESYECARAQSRVWETVEHPLSGALRCVYCKSSLDVEGSEPIHTCAGCHTLAHKLCAVELGMCPTLGCRNARVRGVA